MFFPVVNAWFFYLMDAVFPSVFWGYVQVAFFLETTSFLCKRLFLDPVGSPGKA